MTRPAVFEQGKTTGQVRFSDLFTKAARVEGMGGADIPAYASLIVQGGRPAWHGLDSAVAMEAICDSVDNVVDVDLRSLEGRSEPVRMAALLKTLVRAVAEAVGNPSKLRSRLKAAKLGPLASLCVITGGQASFTRADGAPMAVVEPGGSRSNRGPDIRWSDTLSLHRSVGCRNRFRRD